MKTEKEPQLEFKEGLFPYVKSLQKWLNLTDEEAGKLFYYIDMWNRKRYFKNQTYRICGVEDKPFPETVEQVERYEREQPIGLDTQVLPPDLSFDNLKKRMESVAPPPVTKSLQDCKDEIARKYNFNSWDDLYFGEDLNKAMLDDLCKLCLSVNNPVQEWISRKEDLWLAYKASNTVWNQKDEGLRDEFEEWYNNEFPNPPQIKS